MASETLNILIPLYEGYNALDVNGPLDAFCNAALRPDKNTLPFKAFTAAKYVENPKYAPDYYKDPDYKKPVQAFEFISTKPDYTFKEALGEIKAGKIDILLIPGGISSAVNAVIENPPSDNCIQHLITTFMASDNKGSQKWLMSVCVGALLAGAAGVFKDRVTTTHWAALSGLADVCKKFDAIPASIVRRRWVDCGTASAIAPAVKPTRIVSSGGISCGLDCSLWLIKQILGPQQAVDVAAVMDYHWNGGVEEMFRPSADWLDGQTAEVSQQWTTKQTLDLSTFSPKY